MQYFRTILAAVWMHLVTLVALLIFILTCGLGLEWLRQRFLPPCARVFLAIFGIRVRVRGALPQTAGPAVWICNHRSTLDIFVILALGLPRTRYFLSDFLQRIPAFFILGRMLGSFWTPDQKFSEQRVLLFQSAARKLRDTGDSVFLTPEGQRIDSRLVGKFNKGAFHLAMDLGLPLIPIFIETPDDISPGLSWNLRKGVVDVSFLDRIESPGYQEERLPIFVSEVRQVFLQRASCLGAFGKVF